MSQRISCCQPAEIGRNCDPVHGFSQGSALKRPVRLSESRQNATALPRLAAAALLCFALPLQAADFVVNTNLDINSGACTPSACSLRDAVLAANATAGASTIRLGSANYSVGIQGFDENEGLVGDFDIKGDLTIIGDGVESTSIGTTQLGEQIVDVAAGARLRLEHLRIGIGLRSGGFGEGNVDATQLELFDVQAGATSGAGNTIVAKGNLLIDRSSIMSSNFSPGQAALHFNGVHLDIANSTMVWPKVGLRIDLGSTGSARIANSFLTRDDPYRSNTCGSLEIIGGQNVRIIGSQVTNRAAIGVGTCINGAQDVAIIDSAITVDGNNYNNAISITAATTTIRNSTIVGSLGVGTGTTLLDHVTVGSNFYSYGTAPFSIASADGASVTVSNSALIGACSRSVIAQGNNVESPGNTCGLPAATSRVDQTYASLELGELASHTPANTPVVPVNFLPSAMSVLNAGLTAEGLARCQVTDQRGYVRAAACTIGAVETNAVEQVLFRSGFDN